LKFSAPPARVSSPRSVGLSINQGQQGQTFAELVDSRFAKPLGLDQTRVIDPATMPSNFSYGRFNFNGTAHTTADVPLNSYVTFNVAHIGLVSTLSEQLTLVRSLSTGTISGLHRLPTPDNFKADHLLSDSDGDRYVGDKFPLNLHCPCQAAGGGFTGTAIGRRANDVGALTHWYYFPKTDIAVVIHNNSNEEATPLEVMNLVYRIYRMVSADVVPTSP
jgi:CubicO group peptidase (beta-lactamase class C family)